MNRKNFLWKTAWFAGSITTMPYWLSGKEHKLTKADPLSAEKVKDFVIAGHNDLEKLKSLLQEFPTLIYATWDWGGGDFETAIEGAGHMGNKEIANYLIEIGARTNLFVLTMLGKTQIVKSFIKFCRSVEVCSRYFKPANCTFVVHVICFCWLLKIIFETEHVMLVAIFRTCKKFTILILSLLILFLVNSSAILLHHHPLVEHDAVK